MSIKYLQDQQLNQVQRSPNDSPWAKLVAQSELLERSRMRQPQGQAPQGTVAGDIQQQLMATQQQESERQNAELQKAQLLASLINSGHFAAGGLTQPVGTGAYRGILTSNPSTPQATYIPPDSLDSAAQQKKHGMIQSLLDNSAIGMMQGKANIGDALQSYADLFSGKAFSRGFAEGGDIRGYAAGGETLAEQLQKIAPYISNTETGWTPEAIAKYESAYPQLKQFKDAAERRQAGQMLLEQIKTAPKQLPYPESRPSLLQRLTQTLGQVPEAMAQQNLAPEEAARAARAAQYQDVVNNWPQMEANKANAEALSGARSNLAGTLFNVAGQKEQAANAAKEALSGPRSNLMGTLLNIAEKKEQLANQPKPSMTESMSAAAQNPPHIDTLASRMAAADKANAIKLGDAWTGEGGDAADLFARAKQGLGSLGETVANVARPVGKVLGAVSPIGDVYMAGEAVGGAPNLLAQAIAGSKPSAVPQGELPQLATDLMGTPKIAEMASSYYDKFKNKGNQPQETPAAPQGVQQNAPVGTSPLSGYAPLSQFSKEVASTPQEKVIRPTPGEMKNRATSQNTAVINQVHGQSTAQSDTPVAQAAAQHAAILQANQAVKGSSDEEGQGSVLDSLYNKLKDSAVDYSELAKRISENEYDLARERKDGTFNAILGGIGAALSRAGTYEGVGDRVFKPGIGAIAGAGILGGLKLSEAAEDKYAQGHKENTNALLALQKLKGDSLNNVLDAISAQKQIDVAAQGARNTAAYQAGQLADKAAERAQEQPLKAAQIEELLARAAQYRTNAQQATKDLSESEKSRRNTLLNQFEALLRARATAASNIQTTPEMLADYDKRLRVLDSALSDITGVNVGAAPTTSAPSSSRINVISREQIK